LQEELRGGTARRTFKDCPDRMQALAENRGLRLRGIELGFERTRLCLNLGLRVRAETEGG
jgi:hypothetical protein